MKVRRAAGILLFVVWESFWLYEYVTASTPDQEMKGPAALLFGVALPIVVTSLTASLHLAFRAYLKHHKG